jgi:hypothetical protein
MCSDTRHGLMHYLRAMTRIGGWSGECDSPPRRLVLLRSEFFLCAEGDALDSVLFDLRVKLLAGDSEQCGSSNLIAVGALQRSCD